MVLVLAGECSVKVVLVFRFFYPLSQHNWGLENNYCFCTTFTFNVSYLVLDSLND